MLKTDLAAAGNWERLLGAEADSLKEAERQAGPELANRHVRTQNLDEAARGKFPSAQFLRFVVITRLCILCSYFP